MIRLDLLPETHDRCLEDVSCWLRSGAVGIMPTETVYGLVCAHSNHDGPARIRRIKGRDPNRKFQLLLNGAAEAEALLAGPAPAALARLADAFWPGPLTVVLPGPDGDTLGLRVPDHAFVRAVIRRLGEPLVATSANPSGVEPADSAAAGFDDLVEPPDFLVRDRGGEAMPAIASTVVLLGDGPAILREGALPADRVLAVAGAPT